MKYRIVSDSSSNMLEFTPDVDYKTVPLKMRIDGKEYVDDENLDILQLVTAMEANTEKSSTSCPNIQEWLDAFEGADVIFAITISSNLSGSYNSAVNAKEMYLETHPEAKIHVVDSLSTGGEMELIIEYLRDCFLAEMPFEEIVEKVSAYQKTTHLIFTLYSLRNLANNGRVSPAIAKIASLLNIRFLGTASEEGTIQQDKICRGEKKLLAAAVQEMISLGYDGKKVRISNCINLTAAEKLKDLILEKFPAADVTIRTMTGLCTYYAERGGMIIGFETA